MPEYEIHESAWGATADLSVKADAIPLACRRRLAEWEARGWRIDSERLRNAAPGSALHVIPSPARRETRNRVFDTVPLRGPRAAA